MTTPGRATNAAIPGGYPGKNAPPDEPCVAYAVSPDWS
jgi:hypothetical protein